MTENTGSTGELVGTMASSQQEFNILDIALNSKDKPWDSYIRLKALVEIPSVVFFVQLFPTTETKFILDGTLHQV